MPNTSETTPKTAPEAAPETALDTTSPLVGFSLKKDAKADAAVKAELTRRVKLLANVGAKTCELDFAEGLNAPRVMWEGNPVATLSHSGAYLGLRIKLVADTLLEGDDATLVTEKLQEWLDGRITERLDPLVKLADELNGDAKAPEGAEPLHGTVKTIATQLMERYGVLPREAVDAELRSLDQDQRKGLRRFGVRIGSTSIYIPFILKPHATELRLAAWAMQGDHKDLPAIPTPGMVWVEATEGAPLQFYTLGGFRKVGKLAIRMDMLERLADAVRPLGQTGNEFEVSPEIMGLVGVSGEGFAEAMAGIGYKHEIRKMAPIKAVAEPAPEADAEVVAEAKDASKEEAIKTKAEEVAKEENTKTKAAPEKTSVTADAKSDETPAETGEEELVDRYFFKWGVIKRAPQRRKAAPKQTAAGKNADLFAKARSTGGRSQQINKPNKGGAKGPKRHTAKPKKEKVMDADSPFAALAGLKAQLEKKK